MIKYIFKLNVITYSYSKYNALFILEYDFIHVFILSYYYINTLIPIHLINIFNEQKDRQGWLPHRKRP